MAPFPIAEEPQLRVFKQYAIYTFALMCRTINRQLRIQWYITITVFKVEGHWFFSLALLKNSQLQIHVVYTGVYTINPPNCKILQVTKLSFNYFLKESYIPVEENMHSIVGQSGQKLLSLLDRWVNIRL